MDRQVRDHFFKNSLQKGVFENSWSNTPTCLELYSHTKIVVHFFIPMLLLPQTPPLTYLKLKKIKDQKQITHFTFTSLFLSIAGTAQQLQPTSPTNGVVGVGGLDLLSRRRYRPPNKGNLFEKILSRKIPLNFVEKKSTLK